MLIGWNVVHDDMNHSTLVGGAGGPLLLKSAANRGGYVLEIPGGVDSILPPARGTRWHHASGMEALAVEELQDNGARTQR